MAKIESCRFWFHASVSKSTLYPPGNESISPTSWQFESIWVCPFYQVGYGFVPARVTQKRQKEILFLVMVGQVSLESGMESSLRCTPFFLSQKSVRAHTFDPNLWWLTATSNLHTTFPPIHPPEILTRLKPAFLGGIFENCDTMCSGFADSLPGHSQSFPSLPIFEPKNKWSQIFWEKLVLFSTSCQLGSCFCATSAGSRTVTLYCILASRINARFHHCPVAPVAWFSLSLWR